MALIEMEPSVDPEKSEREFAVLLSAAAASAGHSAIAAISQGESTDWRLGSYVS